MKQILFLFLLLVVTIAFAGWSSKSGNLEKFIAKLSQNKQPQGQSKSTIKIGNYELTVEVASTPDERRVGLSKYTKLPVNFGMLFVFKEKTLPTIWMKNMNFPIDIVWINDDQVLKIDTDVPTVAAGTPDNLIPRYKPDGVVNFVVEFASGEVVKRGINVGDKVIIPDNIKQLLSQ